MKGKKNISKGVSFLSIIFLLLLSSYAYAYDIQCGCNQCHGNPPIVNTFGAPNGLAGVGFTAGAHLFHTSNLTATNGMFGPAENNVCYVCHFNGMPFTSVCGNTQLQIGFNINGGGGSGTTYDGSTTLKAPFTYNGNNGTTITQNGSQTCTSIYCHSDGTAVATGVIPTGHSSPAWDSQATIACTACHAYPPLYAQDQPKANSHFFHQGFTCNFCHVATTKDGVTIADPTKHANGVYDVAPDPGASGKCGSSYVTPSFTYAFDPGGGKCSSVNCHSTCGVGTQATWTWGNETAVATISYMPYPELNTCYQIPFYGTASAGTAPYTYSWNFGDGTTSTVQNPVHLFPAVPNGSYPVTLTVRDVNRHMGTSSLTMSMPSSVCNGTYPFCTWVRCW